MSEKYDLIQIIQKLMLTPRFIFQVLQGKDSNRRVLKLEILILPPME